MNQPAPKSAERPKYAPPAVSRMFGSPGAVEKSIRFGPSLKRLIRRLRPERLTIIMVIALAVFGILMSVVGPKILGRGTDVIFTGVIGRQLPAGASKDQVVAGLRAAGQETYASCKMSSNAPCCSVIATPSPSMRAGCVRRHPWRWRRSLPLHRSCAAWADSILTRSALSSRALCARAMDGSPVRAAQQRSWVSRGRLWNPKWQASESPRIAFIPADYFNRIAFDQPAVATAGATPYFCVANPRIMPTILPGTMIST